jgi:hypothetical protein
MAALPSQLTFAPAGVLARTRSAKAARTQPRIFLRAIGDQVRALFLAQRPPTSWFGSAWAAEDDYARFSNRSR